MKYAIIDIGTNSVRYMFAEYKNSVVLPLYSYKTTTRLGEGLYAPEHRLCDKPVADTIYAVKKYADLSRANAADVIICTATSAVRDACNSAEFCGEVKRVADIEPRILTGEEEATAGFMGALGDMRVTENAILADIGGGSTEIVSCREGKITGKSYQCGCVRLREMFGKKYEEASKYISDSVLAPDNKDVIWIGGSATAAAMIYGGLKKYSASDVHMTTIPAEFIVETRDKALTMTDDQLASLCSFDVKRGEIIVYGLMIMSHILSQTKSASVTVSEKGLMDGIIALHFSGKLKL